MTQFMPEVCFYDPVTQERTCYPVLQTPTVPPGPQLPKTAAGPKDLALAAREIHTATMRKARHAFAEADNDIEAAANIYIDAFQSAGLLSEEERRQIEMMGAQILRAGEYDRKTVARVREIFDAFLDTSASPVAIMLGGGALSSMELTAEGTVSPGVASSDWIGALGGGAVGAGIGSAGGPFGTAAGAVLGGSVGLAAGSIAAVIDDM